MNAVEQIYEVGGRDEIDTRVSKQWVNLALKFTLVVLP